MEEMLIEYLENTFYVILSTPESYYCLDKTTNNHMNLNSLVKETKLIFGEIDDKINYLVHLWVANKTSLLKEIAKDYISLYYTQEMTIEEINKKIIGVMYTKVYIR
jgi:uncharacterized protein YdhG (YjbR/CyaY superfamily)